MSWTSVWAPPPPSTAHAEPADPVVSGSSGQSSLRPGAGTAGPGTWEWGNVEWGNGGMRNGGMWNGGMGECGMEGLVSDLDSIRAEKEWLLIYPLE